MSLLKWPRRSLFSITVAAGVTAVSLFGCSGRRWFVENNHGTITGIMLVIPIVKAVIAVVIGIFAEVTPTATFAPVARFPHVEAIPGALPQAVICCAYGARCLRR